MMFRLPNFLFVAALLFGGISVSQPANADQVTVRGTQGDGFARLTFTWPSPVPFVARIVDRQLVVQFGRPVETNFAGLPGRLSAYIGAPRLSGAGRTVTFPLKNEYDLNFNSRGRLVTVDLIELEPQTPPQASQPAPPPAPKPAPQQAQSTPRPVAPPAPAAAPVPSQRSASAAVTATTVAPANLSEKVGVRTGQHPDYGRLVFDWTKKVPYKVDRQGNRASISFGRPADINLSRVQSRRAQNVGGAESVVTGAETVVVLNVPSTSRVRHFLSGSKVVFDVFNPTGRNDANDPPPASFKPPQPPQQQTAAAEPPAESNPQATAQAAPAESSAVPSPAPSTGTSTPSPADQASAQPVSPPAQPAAPAPVTLNPGSRPDQAGSQGAAVAAVSPPEPTSSHFLPLQGDGYLIMGGSRTAEEIAKFSAADAAMLPEYERRIGAVGDVLRYLTKQIPPNAGGGTGDLMRAIQQARAALRLPLETQRDAIDMFTRSAREFLDGFFESEPIKAALGFDSVVGAYHSPDTPGSAYVLLHHVFGEVNGKRGAWGHAIGGMGSITQAMAKACNEAGVAIRTEAPVAKIIADSGRAEGVETASGERILADVVAGNVHPKRLLLEMLEDDLIDPALRRRMEGHKSGSGTFRMNVALSELPRFACSPEPGPHLSSGIIIAPNLDYMDRAWVDAREHGWSKAPIVEMLIPSTLDDSLAPEGGHVASLFCQQFDPGVDWDKHREAADETILDTIETHAPGFRASIVGQIALSPLDLERRFGLIGGDIFHGRMSLDQLWAMRPLLGFADHRMPVPGLYLCGSGAHPGGGVTGRPGRNAAAAVVQRRAPKLF